MTTPGDRRNFLRPSNWLRAAGKLSATFDEAVDKLDRMTSEPVVTMRQESMACFFCIQFGVLETERRAVIEAFQLIDDLEAQMTVYRDDSEVSQFNRLALEQAAVVEPQLFELFVRCRQMTSTSAGAFDITAGPLIRTWGFERREGRLPTAEALAEALAKVGMSKVTLDEAKRTISFTQAGVSINLGAVGKGYALDRAAVPLRNAGFQAALLSAGHSSFVAIDRPSWDDRWRVDLTHPLDLDQKIAVIGLREQAFSTSGVAAQAFVHDGKRYCHIIDPRNGWPVSGVLQASAVAKDGATAEMLSTVFFVNGPEWTARYCHEHPEVGAVVVPDPGDNDADLELQIFGNIDVTAVPSRKPQKKL